MNNLIDYTRLKLVDEIHKFRQDKHKPEALRIYMPLYFRNAFIEEYTLKVIDVFNDEIEPFKFMGIEVLEGYENCIVVANSGKVIESRKLNPIRIQISQ